MLLANVQLTYTSSPVPEPMLRSANVSLHDVTVTMVLMSVRRAVLEPRRIRWGMDQVLPVLVSTPLVTWKYSV